MKNYRLSEKLKEIRNGCNKTQAQFAQKLGVSRITVQNYENEITTPSVEVLIRYCELGKVSMDYLLDTKNSANEDELVSLVMSLSSESQEKLLVFLKTFILH